MLQFLRVDRSASLFLIQMIQKDNLNHWKTIILKLSNSIHLPIEYKLVNQTGHRIGALFQVSLSDIVIKVIPKKCSLLFFPNLALISAFASQMTWQGFFSLQIFPNSYATTGNQTHVSQ